MTAHKKTLSIDALKLIEQHCTIDRIKELLSKGKERAKDKDKLVRKSAKNKSALIDELKDACSDGFVDISEIYELIQESEESTAQNIYIYLPISSQTIKYLSFQNIDPLKLLSCKSTDFDSFPKFLESPQGVVASDFRETCNGGWIAKLYNGQTKHEKIDEGLAEGDASRWIVEYAIVNVRKILIIEWVPELEILVFRFSRCNGEVERTAELKTIKSMFSEAFPDIALEEYSLENVLTKVVKGEYSIPEITRIHDAALCDTDQGTLLLHPPKDGAASGTHSRRIAIENCTSAKKV